MLRVLAYHRVTNTVGTNALNCPNISASPDSFARQMAHVAKHYRAVGMPEVLEAIRGNGSLPERSVLITFDDAYADFAEIAWPILRQFRLPVTLFVPTAYPDHPELTFWWDRLYQAFAATTRTVLPESPLAPLPLENAAQRRRSLLAIIRLVPGMPHDSAIAMVDAVCAQLVDSPSSHASVLSWNQLRQLANDGVTLGSHTRTHPIMTQIAPPQIRDEIRRSQQDLVREIGFALPIFCYPNGNYNHPVIDALREEGISAAFTVVPGENRLESTDPLQLGRTCIWPRTSLPIFRLRLRRVGLRLDAWRQKWQRPVITPQFSEQEAQP